MEDRLRKLRPSWLCLVLALLALTMAVILLPGSASPAGNTYYVSTGGSDQNPGTLGQPWRSIQHAADSVGPGDSVYVRGGTYNEGVILASGGTAQSPVTYAAYPGEQPVLSGGGSIWAGFQLGQGVSHVRIEEFTFTDFRQVGIDLVGTNSYIEIADIDSSGAEGGMRLTWGYSGDPTLFGPVDHITITESNFHNNNLAGIDCTPGPCDDLTFTDVRLEDNGTGAAGFAADGLAVERGTRITLDRVQSIGNGGDGIDLNSRDYGPVEGILVRRSISGLNQRNGIKLWAGGRLENNLIYGSGFNPLPLAAFDNVTIELVNNTVAYNMWDAGFAVRDYAMTVGYPEGEAPLTGINLTMVNNVFAFNTGPSVGSPTGIYLGEGVSLTENNNLFYSRDDCEIQAAFTARECYAQAEITGGTWTAETGQGGGDLVADPLFTDGPGLDFHLATGSPALNGGSGAGAPALDLDGRPRPRDGGYDIGAYEGSASAFQPALSWGLDGVYWASYGDYNSLRLSARYTLANNGPGPAFGLSVTDSVSSNGVWTETPLPLALADLTAGSSIPVVLSYRVPVGVTAYQSITHLRCTDGDGVEIFYP